MENYNFRLPIVLLLTILFFSCKKNDSLKTDCFPNEITTRTIVDKQAIIKSVSGKYYIVEQGAIDTKLIPCNLAQEFQVDNLQVTISGEVKATLQGGPGPCCSENFIISKIKR
jgi:hypothetical protein